MITGLLSRVTPVSILVIGDLILDTYTIGKVKRISPEAPVGIVHVNSEEVKPGGACNVSLNLLSLGSTVQLAGRIGPDAAGQKLLATLQAEGVDTSAILTETNHRTPHKNRIIADNRQIIRVDHEEVAPLSPALEDQFIDQIPSLIKGKNAIAVSDYGKGLLTPRLLRALIAEAKKQNVPVIVDPKGSDFTRYSGATLVKPNQSEAYAAAHKPSAASLEDVAETIFTTCNIDHLMITRSQHGITVFDRNGTREDYPAQMREIKDVTGAGDTVLAMVTCAIANGLNAGEASQLANAAAGIAIEHIGCARVTIAELAKKLLAENAENKVFDNADLYALKQALNGSKYIFIDLKSETIHPKAYRAISDLKKEGFATILCCSSMDDDAFQMLIALRDIDFIIREEHSRAHLISFLAPEKIYAAHSTGIAEVAELAVN